MNSTDRLNIGSAALVGDASLMRRVADAQHAIIDLLQGDVNGICELSDFHRHGLLMALEQMADSLEDRASFIEDSGIVGGGES